VKRTILTIILIIALNQLYGQEGFLQIGFGMNQNVHTGRTFDLDSIQLGPNSKRDELRPVLTITYLRKINDRFEIEFGINYSNIYHSYFVSSYNQSIGGYVKKVGVKRVTALAFPLNVNFRIVKAFCVKLGLSASFGIPGKSDNRYFNDVPEINEIYNSMQDIFNPHSFGYGIGCGYRISNFDISYYRRTTITNVAKPITIGETEFDVFGDIYSNSISVFIQ
jgi:hypothetical protein